MLCPITASPHYYAYYELTAYLEHEDIKYHNRFFDRIPVLYKVKRYGQTPKGHLPIVLLITPGSGGERPDRRSGRKRDIDEHEGFGDLLDIQGTVHHPFGDKDTGGIGDNIFLPIQVHLHFTPKFPDITGVAAKEQDNLVEIVFMGLRHHEERLGEKRPSQREVEAI
jgi:hypothetical protein